VRGRNIDGRLVPYPTRREIEATGMLRGSELVYLQSPLDAYIVQVNGSAKLNLPDGRTLYVGYAGTNGLQYTSIGRLLVANGVLKEHEVNLPAIRRYFTEHPEQLDEYVLQNDRYVFFREYDGSNWPAGSLGFRVEPMRSLATDKEIFPRGSVVLVDTTLPGTGQTPQPFVQLMVDQDTGGAIRAAGRADIYLGQGPHAEDLAGRQAATGRLFYLLLKPEAVPRYTR
jgi:membrane-bound lytic murein transglycosylase A